MHFNILGLGETTNRNKSPVQSFDFSDEFLVK